MGGLDKHQVALVGHAAGLIAVLLVAVPTLTIWLGGPAGYLASFAIYWLGFCLPVILRHIPPERRMALLSPRLERKDLWVPAVLALQVSAVSTLAFFSHLGELSLPAMLLGAAIGLVNGTLEESAWRGGFISRFGDRRMLGFWLGWALFTVWHIPLGLSQGIVFDGGVLSLIGGAAGPGLLWSAIAWRTGSVFWVTAAHALTNAAAFPMLFQTNGFV